MDVNILFLYSLIEHYCIMLHILYKKVEKEGKLQDWDIKTINIEYGDFLVSDSNHYINKNLGVNNYNFNT